ncbi:PH domain-like protein [Metschnikowia bicuspidata var. bicuspidata NRRL YB-4993]|uniref:PH domain-like protein n=1 Tax=Metschnikowia bicuspidata var. bicuspidata NRRL YB-4993 TaxID=869754 RepID=A0A1A0HBY4_9ASCO|nr:PH domain-like protein [Metschnikowia bicuspidata var. bicuspidata NRRL YB-4993]OBA21387.1 PH domain-like protein [Metschnikowia bicuspidata var. bicuspidata NRRL YB-4993]
MTDGSPAKKRSISQQDAAAKKAKTDLPLDAEIAVNALASDSTSTGHRASSLADDGAPQKTTSTAEKEQNNPAPLSADADKPVFGTTALPGSAKPVFGAASTFGNASIFDRMKNNTNVFDAAAKPSEAAQEQAAPATLSFGSFGGSFGAGSKFSNALQKASQKKSFLDEPKETDTDKEVSLGPSSQQYKQVDLSEKKVETGEENEKSVYSATAKLFELDLSNISEGWKERGRGPVHVNQAIQDPAQARLVMRSNGLLRVILNYKISQTTTLLKGLEASLSPGKFLRMTAVSAEGKPVQYMLKFLSEEIRDALVDKVSELKEQIKLAASPKPETAAQPPATGFRFISDSSENEAGGENTTLQRLSTNVDPGNE